MRIQEIEDKAETMMTQGYNCAETVSKIILDDFDPAHKALAVRCATPFGGGIARSLNETCGAMSGGILALGFLLGRNKASQSWDSVQNPASEYVERFSGEFGSCNCAKILKEFGEQEDWAMCRNLVGKACVMLHDILDKNQVGDSRKEQVDS